MTFLDWEKTEEKETEPARNPVTYLSYSQLSTFTTCPLQYKYHYVLKIPVPPTAALTFGSIMHAVVRDVYARRKAGRDCTKETLLSLLNDHWTSVGFGDRGYEEKMKSKGNELLLGFWENAYDPNIVPVALEEAFAIRVSTMLKLGGKIDRVDELPGGKIEIIDYKTGQSPKGRDVTKDTQLTVYALAATDKGIYGKKPQDVVVSFYFFESREKVSTVKTEKELTAVKEKVLRTAEEIGEGSFLPTPGRHCDFCEFRLICEAWQ